MLLIQCFTHVRLAVPRIHSWRSFSCLQVKNLVPVKKIRPCITTTCVRWRVYARKTPRHFRPKHSRDGVNKKYEMIFENNQNRLLFWCQLFMYSTTIPVIAKGSMMIYEHFDDIPSKLHIMHPVVTAGAYAIFGCVLLLFVNRVCRLCVKRIYFDPEKNKYIAVVQNWMMINRKINFELVHARRQELSVFRGKIGNLFIKNKQYFVVPTNFTLPAHYNCLLGYDRERSTEKDVPKDLDIVEIIKEMKEREEKEKRDKIN